MNPKLAAGTVAIAVVGAAAFVVQRAVFSGSEDAGFETGRLGEIALEGVPTADLVGLGLSPPLRDYAPKLSAEEAKQGSPNEKAAVMQILLAHLMTRSTDPIDSEVWVINYDPDDPNVSRTYPPCNGIKGVYFLELVDAHSGKALLSASGEARHCPG